MNNEVQTGRERDGVFSAITQMVDMNCEDSQGGIQKLMEAIAADGSLSLQFANRTYLKVKEIISDLDKNELDCVKLKLQTLAKEILEFRKSI